MSAAAARLPSDIERRLFDLVVIGAGCNGAGIARDAAMRGLEVLLVDKGDIGNATSSWNSRLIHGGLRYLEHGEIGLVRESLRERETLLRVARHLVRPLALLIPIYDANQRRPWMVRLGMIAYDLLSPRKSLPRHRMLSREETLSRAPGLNPRGLRGAALYHDCQVEYPERLVLENALEARDHGAVVLTHARVTRLLAESNAARGVEFTDRLTNASVVARGRAVVNAAGPWVDEVLRGLDPPLRRLIGGTKGSHVVVSPFAGAPDVALYIEARCDHRPVFVLPWNGLYLIGTTDICFEGNPDDARADEHEIEYLLGEVNRAVPDAKLTRERIHYLYSGVRPLPRVEQGAEAAITRRHILHHHAARTRGLFSVVGGKLTTYRSLAEQAVDAVLRELGRAAPACATAETPLPGGRSRDVAAYRDRLRAHSALPAASAEHLARVYGTRATDVLALAAGHSDLQQPLGASSAAIGAEVVMALHDELAVTLADVLLRRTMEGLRPSLGLDVAGAAAEIARRHGGWDHARAQRELDAYRQHVEEFHRRSVRDATRPPQLDYALD
jgi:glycerol-3-phosphate dehydrogenase